MEWKTVIYKGKKTKYIISEYGDLENTETGTVYKRKLTNSGYINYNLSLGNKVSVTRYAHRLVAEHFLHNEKNYPQVNHIDGNKTNNHVSILEWVTRKENMRHCFDSGLSSVSKAVERYGIDGIFIDEYQSASEAARRLGMDAKNISSALLGNYKSAYGYQWKFKDSKKEILPISENDIFTSKGVNQLTLDGEFIEHFEKATYAYKKLGKTDNGSISQVCKGNKKTYAGFLWEYSK